jgi:peptide/nickel transport system ATP-binding protein
MSSAVSGPVLAARDLRVRIGRREIVRGISFDVQREQTLGIVGRVECPCRRG